MAELKSLQTMPFSLSHRQLEILTRVVEEHVGTGQPVGSKYLVERAAMGVSSSTVRSELAELETLGLLTHPHTSAGRVPTERGYRFYVDTLLTGLEPRPAAFPLDRAAIRSEIDAALQATTDVLSQVTHLLALVSGPPPTTATVRHVEVLQLQPQLIVVVVITSTGGVAKRVVAFDQAVDPGVANWADEYLNERVAAVQLGTHALRSRLEDPSLSPRERAFLDALRPVFTDLVDLDEQRVFVGGAAGLLDEARAEEREACQRLLTMLERRAALLELIGEALEPRRPFVRVGDELDHPDLRNVSLVGATYGLTNRTLGAVTLLGPLRMDYGKAIREVRAAAHELSRLVEEIYEPN
jgi:heat-inducible transcriptional repressor